MVGAHQIQAVLEKTEDAITKLNQLLLGVLGTLRAAKGSRVTCVCMEDACVVCGRELQRWERRRETNGRLGSRFGV